MDSIFIAILVLILLIALSALIIRRFAFNFPKKNGRFVKLFIYFTIATTVLFLFWFLGGYSYLGSLLTLNGNTLDIIFMLFQIILPAATIIFGLFSLTEKNTLSFYLLFLNLFYFALGLGLFIVTGI